MPSLVGQMTMQTAQNAIDTGMGMLLSNYNDRRQIKQQQKLQNMQIAGSKELTDYNVSKQMEIWKNTNYSAQAEELEKAGLNRGLLYGMGGGGGQSSSINTGSVNSGQAPSGGREIQDIIGIDLLGAKTAAEIQVMQSQAKKNIADANATSGTQTEESQTRIKSLTQGIQNQLAQEALTKAETRLKVIEGKVQGDTIEDRIEYIQWNTQLALNALYQAENETFIKKATRDDIIDTIKREAIAASLRNILIKAESQKVGAITKNVKQDTLNKEEEFWLTREQRTKLANDIMLGWDSLTNEQRKARIQEVMQQFKEETYWTDKLTGIIEQAVDGVMKRTPGRNPK